MRRGVKLFATIFMAFALVVFFQNCGPGNFQAAQQSSEQNEATISSEAWEIGIPLMFVFGSADTIDLKATLPQNAKPNGIFFVDNSGSNLPMGMSLSASGLLFVGTAAVGDVSGVIFGYTEP